MYVRVYVRAHGASALNKVTESSLALPKGRERCCSVIHGSVQLEGIPAVRVCVTAEHVCVSVGEVWGLCLNRVSADQSQR